MEVSKPDADRLKHIVAEWFAHSEQELEATFGHRGSVSSMTFYNVMRRLQNRGYKLVGEEDRLNIMLPNNYRFTLAGLGQIQGYCRDNSIAEKPFTLMVKDSTGVEPSVDIKEYDVRVKARRELFKREDDDMVKPIIADWAKQNKAFRLIHRWSFTGHGIRFDLSIVRSSQKTDRGQYKYVKNFADYNFIKAAPTYEIEVELVRDEIEDVAKATGVLVKAIGEVLRGIQRNTVLIRKSVHEDVLISYKALTGTDRFRGVAPVTLMLKNMEENVDQKVPNIRTGYNVTDKADGARVHAYMNATGELFLIDMGLNVYRSGLRIEVLKNSLLDAEWVTRDKDGKPINMLLLFDIYYDREGKNMTKQPFRDAAGQGRYAALRAWAEKFNEGEGPEIIANGVNIANQINVSMKTFYFGAPGDRSIFSAAADMLAIPQIYHTDGLIFTPNASPLPQDAGRSFMEQLKWKPAEENSVDFLINYEKNPELVTQDKIIDGENPESGEVMRYKVLRLYVGSSRDPAYADPRTTILNDLGLPSANSEKLRGQYKPALFNPMDPPDTMANICYGRIETDLVSGNEYIMTEDGEQVADRSIVEMRYDPSREAGWRWIPMRVRHDKTERLNKGIYNRTLNAEMTANSVWESIHDPITGSMIRTGAETPTAEEIQALTQSRVAQVGRRYYAQKATKTDLVRVQGLRAFHNNWIKDRLLLSSVMREGGKTLVDLACGKAGDLHKWMRLNADFVLGVDAAGDGIRDPSNGAYRRYMDLLVQKGAENVPRMVFAIADSSKPLVSGEAGATVEEGDILRAVFKQFPPEGALPAYIGRVASGALRGGANVAACMFALHYFFESAEKLDGLLQNLAGIVPIGGYFVGCSFDGDKVFDMLAGIKMGDKKTGADGDTQLWTITKKYGQLELPVNDTAFGMAIDVDFVSIGATHMEYLIPFKLLVKKMRNYGFELLSDDEAKAVGLVQGSNLFEPSYKMAVKAGQKFAMSDAVKEFSFLNRWYIFKRNSEEAIVLDDTVREMMGQAAEEAASAVATAAGAKARGAASAAAVAAAASLPKTDAGLREKQRAQAKAAVLANIEPAIYNAASERAASPEVRIRPAAAAANEEEGPGAGPARKYRAAAAAAAADEGAAPAAAAAAATPGRTRHELSEIFQFYINAPEIVSKQQDVLGVKTLDKYAQSRLATIFPFVVEDVADDGSIVRYPSVEHYAAAMMIKRCARNPVAAKTLFDENGLIHDKFKGERRLRKISERTFPQLQESLKDEMREIQEKLKPAFLRTQKITGFNASNCQEVMMDAFRDGYKQRLARDATFRAILQKAAEKQMYLLNYDLAGTDLTGRRLKTDGTIKGNNKIGKVLMDLAGIAYE